jgi:hypothetical protein
LHSEKHLRLINVIYKRLSVDSHHTLNMFDFFIACQKF